VSAVLDRLLWFPRNSVLSLLPHIKQELTVRPDTYRGKAAPFCLMVEGSDWVGVPRAWGMTQKWLPHHLGVEDRTVRPFLKWPAFVGSYRTGQQESVDQLVHSFESEKKYGALLEAKTGTGKTVMALAIAALLDTPTLVVVHKEDLADQWQMLLTGGMKGKIFVDPLFPGGEVGHIQGDKWDYQGKHLTTAMAQTLYSRQGQEPEDFWRQFGLVIYDEGHRYPARTFEAVLARAPARFRMAVSATWRRRDKLECIWHWHVGSLEHRTKGVHLVGEYAIVQWHTNVQDRMFLQYRRVNHASYLTAIAKNAPYNEWLADQLIKGAQAGRQTLLCSHRTEQLSDIRKRILKQGLGLSVGYYAGRVDNRLITKDELETTKKCQIVLATFAKMAEGTDISTLDTLILATPAADVEQVVGRIQRPEIGKRPLLVVDPVWQTPYNIRLHYKRKKVYQRLGFTPQPKETKK